MRTNRKSQCYGCTLKKYRNMHPTTRRNGLVLGGSCSWVRQLIQLLESFLLRHVNDLEDYVRTPNAPGE